MNPGPVFVPCGVVLRDRHDLFCEILPCLRLRSCKHILVHPFMKCVQFAAAPGAQKSIVAATKDGAVLTNTREHHSWCLCSILIPTALDIHVHTYLRTQPALCARSQTNQFPCGVAIVHVHIPDRHT